MALANNMDGQWRSLTAVLPSAAWLRQLVDCQWCWWALSNVAFLVVVGWLTAGRDPWWMGPAISAGYSVAWFVVAHNFSLALDRGGPAAADVVSVSSSNVGDTPPAAADPPKKHPPTSSPNVPQSKSHPNQSVGLAFYGGMVTVGLVVLGWYLARLAIHCRSSYGYDSRYYEYEFSSNHLYDSGIYHYDEYGSLIPTSRRIYEWTTDLSKLPVHVQQWAAPPSLDDDDDDNNYTPISSNVFHRATTAGLVYLPGSMTTIFNELTDTNLTIWSVSPAAPQPVALYKGPAYELVRIHDHQACFVVERSTTDNDHDPSDNINIYFGTGDRFTVACTDGVTVTMTADGDTTATTTTATGFLGFRHRTGPRDLFVDAETTGMIWYRDYYYDFRYQPHVPEPLIYSLDPTNMMETLHSDVREIGNDVMAVDNAVGVDGVESFHTTSESVMSSSSASSDRSFHCERRTRAFGPIFLAVIVTSLPVAVASLYLSRQQQQQRPVTGSSASPPPQHRLTVLVTLLASMSALTLVLGYALAPRNNPYGDKQVFLSWWTMCFGGVVAHWCALMINRNNNGDDKNNSCWGKFYFLLGIVAIVATSSRILTYHASSWIVFNVVVLAPQVVIGLVAESFFVMILGSAGVLMEARYVSLHLVTHVCRKSNWLVKVSITAAVMGGTAAIVTAALAYWWMRYRYQDLGTTTATFTALPSHDEDEDKFDYQPAPPTTRDVTKEIAAAAARGVETLASLLRRWADQLDRMQSAHQLESAATV